MFIVTSVIIASVVFVVVVVFILVVVSVVGVVGTVGQVSASSFVLGTKESSHDTEENRSVCQQSCSCSERLGVDTTPGWPFFS